MKFYKEGYIKLVARYDKILNFNKHSDFKSIQLEEKNFDKYQRKLITPMNETFH